MVSGVGFKSEANEEQKSVPRKRMVSGGLFVTFIILVLTGGALGGLKMWEGDLNGQIEDLDSQIKQIKKDANSRLDDSHVSDFAMRAQFMKKELYRGRTTNEVLDEIERIMVLNDNPTDGSSVLAQVLDLMRTSTGLSEEKLRRVDTIRDLLDKVQESELNAIMENSDRSGGRVVLKSFEHNVGAYQKKNVNGVNTVVIGPGTVTISADADNFDVMAQQIEKFKNSEYFDKVSVGETDRDDSGRIIFTLTMSVTGSDKTPYEMYDPAKKEIEELPKEESGSEIFGTEDVAEKTESPETVGSEQKSE
ncbi:MAG: hypothetical protein CR972_00705 [Candidatus Moraniibacteriota bacterium]|nr:MAG: hypothetical protein CR972_00705 [Candidatus Moranbacteria bacterium]